MKLFEPVLRRLKERLGLSTDKEVAALLGMSPTAFNDRKKRDAFPEDKLLALAALRPDLQLDVRYILGAPQESTLAQAAATIGTRFRQLRGERDTADFAAELGIAADELQRIEQGAKPPSATLLKRMLSTLDVDPMWLLADKAREPAGDLAPLEKVLLANYRASSPEGQALIRRLAAAGAEYARTGR